MGAAGAASLPGQEVGGWGVDLEEQTEGGQLRAAGTPGSAEPLNGRPVHRSTFGHLSLPVGIRVWEVSGLWNQMDQNPNPSATPHGPCDLEQVT